MANAGRRGHTAEEGMRGSCKLRTSVQLDRRLGGAGGNREGEATKAKRGERRRRSLVLLSAE